MTHIDTVIIGGGQAGLAMSHALTARGVEHVVLERGRVAQAWLDRWDSLTLLTPNWLNNLPGWSYRGEDPDGFMSARDFAQRLGRYARHYAMPVQADTTVLSVRPADHRFRVVTTRGNWTADHVVVATGHCQRANVPAFAADLDPDIAQVSPVELRSVDTFPPGGVLVVGASATGIQIADELSRAGRAVTLAVGRHTRLPRRYRGRDILWWVEATGKRCSPVGPSFDTSDPSPQLVGSPDHRDLDLGALLAQGVRLIGRVVGADRHEIAAADDLATHIADSESRLRRVLSSFDAFAAAHGIECDEPDPIAGIEAASGPSRIDLAAEGIGSIFWATGYRRSYPWLHVPVFDRSGEIKQTHGVTPWPGLYVIGLEYMRRRNSATIDGVGTDARFLAERVAGGRRQEIAA